MNLKLIFERTERLQVADVDLPSLNTRMTEIKMAIEPREKTWWDLELELFMEDQQIVLEMHDLELSGNATIHDPDSGATERVEYRAPINTA